MANAGSKHVWWDYILVKKCWMMLREQFYLITKVKCPHVFLLNMITDTTGKKVKNIYINIIFDIGCMIIASNILEKSILAIIYGMD